MAKILKVKIKREETVARTHYIYPPEYDAQKIQVLIYESILRVQDVRDRGNEDEYLLGVVQDKDVAQFLVSEDIIEIDYSTALNQGNQWKIQTLKIDDPQKVALLCQKIVNNEVLTVEEKNALDADNPELGITKSGSFQEALDASLQSLDELSAQS